MLKIIVPENKYYNLDDVGFLSFCVFRMVNVG